MTKTEESPLSQVQKAYRKLSHCELLLFLKIRNLPLAGSDSELASRLAHHDLHTYHFPNFAQAQASTPTTPPTLITEKSRPPDLPVEILADILDKVGDWELAKAVGVPASLPRPSDWSRASSTDFAMISGRLDLIRAARPLMNPPTRIGAVLAVRFGYVHVLEFFLSNYPTIFVDIFKGDLIPIKASRHSRIGVLSWWKHGFEQHPDLIPPPEPSSIAEAIETSSRNGQVASLNWWVKSGHPLEYTEAALEYASARNQIAVLDWWKEQHIRMGLPLKIGRVMDMASSAGHVDVLKWWATSHLEFKYDRHALQHASCNGKVDVLDWWLGSGLQLMFDSEALIAATRHNRPDVLQWWDRSGLPIQYRMCDIEEALEDAYKGGEAARAWWREKGVDFHANDKEWMKLQNLN
ncbi:hypothetical protein BDN72DRAFT_121183 [Pluteus cervinus]|uniref:Uncharacterized protein n=1 Tax=Pluteus cervinus TaxID=181527 RepID=A0ACD3B7F4_9AGAR|nr:hypothetical protein BDN72DRAFT_121183 [Pluteus cervinus]